MSLSVRKQLLLLTGLSVFTWLLIPGAARPLGLEYGARVTIAAAIGAVGMMEIGRGLRLARMSKLVVVISLIVAAAVVQYILGATDIRTLLHMLGLFAVIVSLYLISGTIRLKLTSARWVVVLALISGGLGTVLDVGALNWRVHATGGRVYVGGPHVFGALSTFLALCEFRRYQSRGRGDSLTLLLVASLAVVLSGSRTSMFALAVGLGSLWLWRREFLESRLVQLSIVLVGCAVLYAAPFVLSTQFSGMGGSGQGVVGQVTGLNRQQPFAEGRQALWAYHLGTFVNAPLTGGGTDAVEAREGGLPGVREGADNESGFTKALARSGIVGAAIPLFFIGMVVWAGRRRRQLAYALAVVMTLFGVTSSLFVVPYRVVSLFGYWLFFSTLRAPNRDDLQVVQARSSNSSAKKQELTDARE